MTIKSNKKEKFIEELIKKTQTNEMQWADSKTGKYSHIVIQPDKIIRIFESAIKDNIIVLAEGKVNAFDHNIRDYYERQRIEVYLLKDDLTLKTYFTEDEVARELLINILDLVDSVVNKDILDIFSA